MIFPNRLPHSSGPASDTATLPRWRTKSPMEARLEQGCKSRSRILHPLPTRFAHEVNEGMPNRPPGRSVALIVFAEFTH